MQSYTPDAFDCREFSLVMIELLDRSLSRLRVRQDVINAGKIHEDLLIRIMTARIYRPRP